MPDRYMKRRSVSLTLREMQIHAIVRFHFTPFGWLLSKQKQEQKKRQQVLVRMCRNWDPCTLLGEL